MAIIDSLDIQITSDTSKAAKSLDGLVTKLSALSSSLNTLNATSLTALSGAMRNFTTSMVDFKASAVSQADFTRLCKGLATLNSLNASNLSSVASGLSQLSVGARNTVGMGTAGTELTNLANGLAKLGGVKVTSATNNLKTLKSDLNGLITSLNRIRSLNFDVGGLTSLGDALSKLSRKTTERAVVLMPQLANGLKQMMITLQSAPAVSGNLIQMTQALGNLASQGSRVGRASNYVTNTFSGLRSGAKSTSTSFSSLASKIGLFYAKFWILIRGFKTLWKSIKSSMNYVEILNYFNKALNQVANKAKSSWSEMGYESAEAYAKSFNERAQGLLGTMSGYTVDVSTGETKSTNDKSLGLAPSTIAQYTAQFAQLSSSMGVSSEYALKLSKALVELGGDLASARNLDFATVYDNLSSGLVGMSRAVDKYGANIRNANLQEELANLGIDATASSLQQADKALLRTIILLNSTEYSWGDLADTLNTGANTLRLVKQNLSNLARTIGNIFLPIVTKVLPYINAFVIALQRLAQSIVDFLGFSDFDWGGSSSASEYLSDIYDESENAADGLDDATASAKKLERQLLGFDEINKLSDNEDKSKSSGSVSSDVTSQLEKALDDALSRYQQVWDKAFNNLTNSTQEMADKIEKVLTPIKQLFIDMFSGKWFEAGQDVSNIVIGINNAISNAISKVDWKGVGNKIGDFLKGIDWKGILMSALRLGMNITNAIKDVWTESFKAAPLETTLMTLFLGLNFTKIGRMITNGLSSAITIGLGTLFSGGASETIFAGLSASFGAMLPVAAIISGVVAEVTLFALELKHLYDKSEDVRNSFKSMGESLSSGLQPILTVFKDTILPSLSSALETIKTVLKEIGDFIDTVLESAIVEGITPVVKYMAETLLPEIADAIRSVWNDVLIPLATLFTDNIKPMLEELKPLLQEIFTDILIPIGKLLGTVVLVYLVAVCNAIKVLTPIIRLLIDTVKILLNTVLVPLFTVLKFNFEAIKLAIEELIAVFKAFANGITEQLKLAAQLVKQIFEGDFGGAFDTLKKMVANIGDTISKAFKDVVDKAFNWGKDLLDNFVKGIKNNVSSVKNAVSDVASTIKQYIHFTVPDKGPLADADTYMPDFMKLLADGIDSNKKYVVKSVEDLTGDISNGATITPTVTASNFTTNNEDMAGNIANALIPIVQNMIGGNNNANVNVTLQGDASKLFSVMQDEAQSYTRRTSRPAFT